MTSSCSSANACSSSRLAAARSAAWDASAPHNQPRNMNVERRHFPPPTNPTSTSAATSTPAPRRSTAHRSATKLVDRVEHRLANVASPDLELARTLAGHHRRGMECGREKPSVDAQPHPFLDHRRSPSLFANCPYPQSRKPNRSRCHYYVINVTENRERRRIQLAAWSFRDRRVPRSRCHRCAAAAATRATWAPPTEPSGGPA